MAKFLTYFENPPNSAGSASQQERFFRVDYGPVAMVIIDSCNGNDASAETDTNDRLFSSAGSQSPDFNPGSAQYAWIETQPAEAQSNCLFSFVSFHHCPYTVGPHSVSGDGQLGAPLQVLTPLFHRYGVDGVFCGHDEMYEHSAVPGYEVQPGGVSNAFDLHVYDIGVGGDGLRGPEPESTNPFQVFLAHSNATEVWDGARLVDGGKHYGHIEVNVETNDQGAWQARMSAVYVFPLQDPGSLVVTGFERRVYNDEVVITVTTTTTTSTSSSSTTMTPPEIVRIDQGLALWSLHAPTGTVSAMYATNLGSIPIEWISIDPVSSQLENGTNIMLFIPPDTNATSLFFRLQHTP
jgi:hypothetical protein